MPPEVAPGPVPATADDLARVRELAAQRLQTARRVVLTTHVTPDADGLGSAIALVRVLRAMGKDARVINCSAAPGEMKFLYRPDEFSVWSRERHERDLQQADVIIATDIGGPARMGRMEPAVRAARCVRIVIDHHIYDNDLFELPLIEIGVSSSAEITADLITALGAPLTADVAMPLYAGLIADTGHFAYDATSPRSHRFAARLLEAGVLPAVLWRQLECHKSMLKMRVLGALLQAVEQSADGRLVWSSIDLAFLQHWHVEARDCFEIVNHLLHIDGVQVGAVFMQLGSNKTKVSLRSAGHVDVCSVARNWTGGGHRFAAGFTVDATVFDEAKRIVLAAVTDAINSAAPPPAVE